MYTNLNFKIRDLSKILAASAILASSIPSAQAADATSVFPDPAKPLSVMARDASISRDSAGLRAWKRSLVPVIATQTLDVASSWNMRELNPVLADASGRFEARAATFKLGAAGVLLCGEYLLVRKHPGLARVLVKLNWSSAALTGAFAAHNYAIK